LQFIQNLKHLSHVDLQYIRLTIWYRQPEAAVCIDGMTGASLPFREAGPQQNPVNFLKSHITRIVTPSRDNLVVRCHAAAS
jgi:hypothetical protein